MTDGNKSLPRVALIGLGTMGTGMAGRLLASHFPTTLYNRNQEKALPFAKQGATVAASPREAAANADVVISMVADDNASRAVWLGETGALGAAPAGAVLVECSTLTVDWVRKLAGLVEQRGCEFLDAPVTGSQPQAAGGQLLFLVGGSAATLERVRPVLAVLGRGVVHLGATGSGALMKLVNNFLCGVQAASMAEALAWMESVGMDRDKANAVLGDGAPGSPILRRTAERVAHDDFDPAFSLRLMAKDLTYALEEASRGGIDLQTCSAALARFRQAAGEGLGEQDFAAVAKSVRAHSAGK